MATTGLGRRRIWTCRSRTFKRPTPSSPTYPSSPRIRWSPPLENASGPSPVRMMTPTRGSFRARSNASRSSKSVRGRNALRTSGRAIVILATVPPSRVAVSYRTSPYSTSPGFHSAPGRMVAAMTLLFCLGRVGRIDSGSDYSHGTGGWSGHPNRGAMTGDANLVAVALDRPAAAVTVRRSWEAGEAVVVLDPGAPSGVFDALLAQARPTHLVDAAGPRPSPGGVPVGGALRAVVL